MEPVEHDAEGTIAKLVPEPVIHAAKIMMDEDHDGLILLSHKAAGPIDRESITWRDSRLARGELT
jgi:hypothetical protein